VARLTNGGTLVLQQATGGGATRLATITFPSTGANADGYSASTVTFQPGAP
jgi:hypothetical protein